MSKHKELAADYFERHQISNECHITSDDRVFHTKGSAESFASTLSDKKVSSFTRDSIKKTDKPKVEGKIKTDKKVFETLELTDENISQILNFGLVKENYINIKALVSHLKLDTENQKAETLITALTDYKLKLQE